MRTYMVCRGRSFLVYTGEFLSGVQFRGILLGFRIGNAALNFGVPGLSFTPAGTRSQKKSGTLTDVPVPVPYVHTPKKLRGRWLILLYPYRYCRACVRFFCELVLNGVA